MSSSSQGGDPYGSCTICGEHELGASSLVAQKLLVNAIPQCGHKFCESCAQKKFFKTNRFACQHCRADVTRDQLRDVDGDELEAERDARIRQLYKGIFNKTADDFDEVDAQYEFQSFEDYQEFVEDIIYKLVHGIDVEATKKCIEQYEKRYMASIVKKKNILDDDLEIEKRRLAHEAKLIVERDRLFSERMQEEKMEKEEAKRRRNRIMLGCPQEETEEDLRIEAQLEVKKTDTVAPAVQQNEMLSVPMNHPLVRLLMSVPEPQVDHAYQPPAADRSSAQIKKVHLAGGYNHASVFHARNISEIESQLQRN